MRVKAIKIELSHDEALVFFEWLAEVDKSKLIPFKHLAEEKVVWKIEGILEKASVEPFDPQYKRLLSEARERVING